MLLCFAGVLAGCQRQKADMGIVSVRNVTETESRLEKAGETEDRESNFRTRSNMLPGSPQAQNTIPMTYFGLPWCRESWQPS